MDKMAPYVAEAGRNYKAGSQTKPASNISGTDGRWKVLYGTVELWKKVNPLVSHLKPSKIYFLSYKLKIVGVHHYVIPTNSSKKITDCPRMFL